VIGVVITNDIYPTIKSNWPKVNTKLHRLVGDFKHVGISSDEVYHHKNEKPIDNRPTNIAVMDKAEHASHHGDYKVGLEKGHGPHEVLFITDIDLIIHKKPIPMYDFTVDKYENMLIEVGASDQGKHLVVSHNSSIYGALVKIAADTTVPLIDGSGNFGSIVEPPAAHRYTEARLSKYSDLTMLSPGYLAVTEMVPNYDNSENEPLILPALLPNFLINGTFGIAMGITSVIPPMKLEPFIPLIERITNGESISVKRFKKAVNICYPYGGENVSSDEAIDQWLTTGSGPLRFDPVYSVNYETRTITVQKYHPNLIGIP
jgi:hypothetical protein